MKINVRMKNVKHIFFVSNTSDMTVKMLKIHDEIILRFLRRSILNTNKKSGHTSHLEYYSLLRYDSGDKRIEF